MTNITKDIYYVGVNDHQIDLFEGQFEVELGMAYNSYLIMDEKIAVMDTIDVHFTDEWLGNLEEVLAGKTPDYLVVHHMEPDHSASIAAFAEKYPDAKIVSSMQAFRMIGQFFGTDYKERQVVVKEGDTLELGAHTLSFITAPMVHWPEVIMSYDSTDKVLFSADAFGKFGANDVEDPEGWACEARRYYFGIVGKYGQQVQAVLKKAAALDIEIICSLHGPVLTEDLGYYLDIYNTWSSYTPEDKGVKVSVHDLARMDLHEAIEDAFRYDRLILASTTYNAEVFPMMKHFIDNLTERNYQNRKIAFVENGSWAPAAAKYMKGMLEGSKDLTFAETTVTIKSALNADSEAALAALAEEMAD